MIKSENYSQFTTTSGVPSRLFLPTGIVRGKPRFVSSVQHILSLFSASASYVQVLCIKTCPAILPPNHCSVSHVNPRTFLKAVHDARLSHQVATCWWGSISSLWGAWFACEVQCGKGLQDCNGWPQDICFWTSVNHTYPTPSWVSQPGWQSTLHWVAIWKWKNLTYFGTIAVAGGENFWPSTSTHLLIIAFSVSVLPSNGVPWPLHFSATYLPIAWDSAPKPTEMQSSVKNQVTANKWHQHDRNAHKLTNKRESSSSTLFYKILESWWWLPGLSKKKQAINVKFVPSGVEDIKTASLNPTELG